MTQAFKLTPGQRWTDKLGLSHGYTSYEDIISPEFYELEREAVFRPSWLFVGRVQQLPSSGSYFTKEIEVLRASVLVTRDGKGEVHAYHNVCPHRGNKLVWNTHADREVSGRCNVFSCKFHGLGFSGDGKIKVVTDKNAWLDDQASKLQLAPIPFEVWNGFIFVNLDRGGPKETLQKFLGDHFWPAFDGYPLDKMTERHSVRGTAKANYKLMYDGFSEVYHASTTHALPFPSPFASNLGGETPTFVGDYYRAFDKHRQYVMARYPDDFTNFDFERFTQAFGTGPRIPFGEEFTKLPYGANPTDIQNWGTTSSMFWPNFFIQIYYPGYLVTYAMWPLAYDQMRFEVDMWMPPSRNFSELLSHKAGVSMFLEAALQDFSMLEATQAGLEMRAFNEYPLTDEEVCVRQYHQEIYKAVEKYKQNSNRVSK